jgi:hypothetical protein
MEVIASSSHRSPVASAGGRGGPEAIFFRPVEILAIVNPTPIVLKPMERSVPEGVYLGMAWFSNLPPLHLEILACDKHRPDGASRPGDQGSSS